MPRWTRLRSVLFWGPMWLPLMRPGWPVFMVVVSPRIWVRSTMLYRAFPRSECFWSRTCLLWYVLGQSAQHSVREKHLVGWEELRFFPAVRTTFLGSLGATLAVPQNFFSCQSFQFFLREDHYLISSSRDLLVQSQNVQSCYCLNMTRHVEDIECPCNPMMDEASTLRQPTRRTTCLSNHGENWWKSVKTPRKSKKMI